MFETARFALYPLAPIVARQLAEYLLRDESLVAKVPALRDRPPEDAIQLARRIEADGERGACRMWGIMTREDKTLIGMVITRNTTAGFDLELLVSSKHDVYDPTDEVCDPVLEWLDDNSDVVWHPPVTLH
ncbi:GNAT family N-acetyltransferase [Noviherbaspirillum aridicola]|uniref:Uncharacterized protein n=1 Tax=Noviherbaspirillum aridicola TaxID=2849687 RepID=A0ABQ4Q4P1_9BURK|nr:hypothetical protein [Noviherbaspirillum aridicola]GIZ52074.1 hypothetical protein NCCP691_20880 [Noviherbaspirillum aridicola]